MAGAMALVMALWTTPKYFDTKLGRFKVTAENKNNKLLFPSVDTGHVLMRSVSVVGATCLIFFALKGLGKK